MIGCNKCVILKDCEQINKLILLFMLFQPLQLSVEPSETLVKEPGGDSQCLGKLVG